MFIRLFIISIAFLIGGCSTLVEFSQCENDDECGTNESCDDNICVGTERVLVTEPIVEDTTWTSDKIWVLENLTLVIPPATLTIEPGTTVLGKFNTGLASLAGARLVADGTREEPIVFTSEKPVGQRLAGDWAGLALVGLAPTNRENFNLRITTDQFDTAVGGDDEDWNCGTLRYVRVEFGGSEVDGRKALKGVTLAGCGSETTVDYVQTHFSDDDGFGVFGGSVDLRHIVSTRARDDGIDFDTGWRGTAQFLAVQQDVVGIEAMEVENLAEDPLATPQTDARIYNYTLIGANGEGARQIGVYNKLGGKGTFSHGLVVGHGTASAHIEGPESAQHANDGEIVIRDTLFYNGGPDGMSYFDLVDDDGFTNYAIYEDPEFNNLFGVDPQFEGDPYDLTDPGWVPSVENSAGVDPPPAGFDPTAVYRGAFAPGLVPWTEGWTAYPRK